MLFTVEGGAVSWQEWLGSVGHRVDLRWLEDEETYGGNLNVEGFCSVLVPHGVASWGRDNFKSISPII